LVMQRHLKSWPAVSGYRLTRFAKEMRNAAFSRFYQD
jgi:hypothetical protein